MRVLIIEDDESLGELLSRVFGEEGFEVAWCKSAAEGLERARGEHDLIVLDWMLPDGDGVSVCSALRERSDTTPVLMLTARGEVSDRVHGLQAGADDYLIKPFEIEELLARMHALTRRSRQLAEADFGGLIVDRSRRRCSYRGMHVELTAREYDLLLRIVSAQGAAVSRAELLRDVWNMSFDPRSGLLDVHVSRLRSKLGDGASRLQTVRNVGYRWAADA